ncbi:MAG: hypothetical protein OEQ18_07345 [Gammaproteobacteria bacterium]|nr:hypothetical protein [Gammaproteobacteria bacterium]
MIKASHLLLCITFIVTGAAAAQTANKQLDEVTTPIGGGTMAVEGSEPFSSDDPTVTLGDGTATAGDTAGNGDMTDSGGSVTNGGGGDTAPTDGPFAELSPGNQKIARALFDAQPVTAGIGGDQTMPLSESGSTENWTLDQIAEAKQHTGWGKLFKEMQEAGAIPEDVKNLGQLVSGKYQPSESPTDPTTMTDVDAETAASGDGTITMDNATQAVDTAKQTRGGKAGITMGTTPKSSGKTVKATRGGVNHSDLVITTGNGRQVHIGAASKNKAKTVRAGKGGKGHSATGRHGGSSSAATVVTTGSGAQAAIGAGPGLGHSKGVTTGAGRSASGGGHGKGKVHTGKGSGKVAITTGGGGKGLTHHRGGGKGKGKIK